MQVGRVPVILADDWVPPDGPDWPSFAVFVLEDRLLDLPAILASYEPRAATMGAAARRAWESYFAPEVQFHRFAEALRELKEEGHSHPNWARFGWPMKRICIRAYDAGRRMARGTVIRLRSFLRGRTSP